MLTALHISNDKISLLIFQNFLIDLRNFQNKGKLTSQLKKPGGNYKEFTKSQKHRVMQGKKTSHLLNNSVPL